MTIGRIAFYIIGPSGSGKDSVITGICDHFKEHISRPPRYITRERTTKDGESHNVITPSIFNELVSKGCFSLYWRANGFSYGYDKQWINDLHDNKIVLLNGSRAYLSEALERYPDLLCPIALTITTDIQRERLELRNRESQDEIEQRITRSDDMASHLEDSRILKIDANQSLDKVIKDAIKLISTVHQSFKCLP